MPICTYLQCPRKDSLNEWKAAGLQKPYRGYSHGPQPSLTFITLTGGPLHWLSAGNGARLGVGLEGLQGSQMVRDSCAHISKSSPSPFCSHCTCCTQETELVGRQVRRTVGQRKGLRQYSPRGSLLYDLWHDGITAACLPSQPHPCAVTPRPAGG